MPGTLDAVTSDLSTLIQDEMPDLVAIRHDLHRHPELSFQEKRTSEVVRRELDALNIEAKHGLAKGTGVVGYLPATVKGGNTLPAVALRADMDALPIVEHTGKPYASVTKGVMHACGHDGHTTMLLGAARVLTQVERPRPVTFVFQPAEEHGGGGDVLCREGALAGEQGGGLGNRVGTVYGMHGWPQLPLGQLATRPGPLMAAVDDFEVTIKGVQSHGAYPHFGKDAILATAHVITALQSIAARNVGPLDSVVVSVGAVHAGTANNIIPEEVRFIGTVRTLRAETKALARERFFEVVRSTARALGCEAKIDWQEGYPVVVNDESATSEVLAIAGKVLGESNVVRLEHPTMGGEDFSYYGRHARACFFFLGLCPKGVKEYPTLHQPEFDFVDEAMPLGVEMFVRLAVEAGG